MPYTYLIGWRKQNKYYYGVRYAKGCHPDELWKTYFTSSKYVKYFVEEYGNPDLIQIRKEFESAEKALEWESRVLRKLGAKDRDDFLNQTDNKGISLLASKKGIENRDPQTLLNDYRKWFDSLSENEKEELRDRKRYGMINKPESSAKSQSEGIREYQLKSWSDPETREKRSRSMRKPKKRVVCPYCEKEGGSNNMYRWHFDKCKAKQT